MDFKIKNWLGIVSIFAVLCLVIVAFWYASVNAQTKASERLFRVSGEGKIVAVPDVARITFGIISEGGKNLADLQKQNTDKSNKIISFLKEQGIDAKDIKTQSYNINPRYQYFDCYSEIYTGAEPRACPPPEIVGYSISQSISVKVRKLDKAGQILAGVVERGANNVYGPEFVVDEPENLKTQARQKAVEQAKQKAKAVARAGGFRLGRLMAINEGFYGGPIQLRTAVAEFGKGGDASDAPTLEPGSEEIVINIELVYEIK